MILCDPYALNTVALSTMKVLQHCINNDILPRVRKKNAFAKCDDKILLLHIPVHVLLYYYKYCNSVISVSFFPRFRQFHQRLASV